MPEFAPREMSGRDMDFSEELEQGKSNIAPLIETMEEECAHVFDDPETSEKLTRLLSNAEEFYDVDPGGWEKLLNNTKQQILRAEDDSEAIDDILRSALTKGTTELM